MQFKDFAKLTPTQQATLIISMHIRNQLEQFHGNLPNGKKGFITDRQMKLLNQTIRQAIFEVLTIQKHIREETIKKVREEWKEEFTYLIMCIPDYWEIPTERAYLHKKRQEKKRLSKTLRSFGLAHDNEKK